MNTIVLATRNKGKQKEFAELLKDLNINVKTLIDFPDIPEIVEDGNSFYENAFIKAKTVAEATNLIAVADDSGLAVDALNGEPGIHSARFSGQPHNDEANNQVLLQKMATIPENRRQASFRCVMVVYTPSGKSSYSEGQIDGVILKKPKGQNGFGYDPLFLLPHLGKTMAELSSEEKNKISHRGTACRKAVPIIKHFLKDVD